MPLIMTDITPKYLTQALTVLDKKIALGVDFGTKFIGLARYYVGVDPFPMPFERFANNKQALDLIAQVVESESIDVIVLGLPYLLDGKETNMTALAYQFGLALEKKCHVPLYHQDETLSSFEAEERMKQSPRYNFKIQKDQIDQLAASIILEDFFKK